MNSVVASNQAQAQADESGQWVTFKLDDETYGINVMQVQEVLRMTEIAPVPGAPYYVLGIINLRGNVVTVLDLRRRFNLDQVDVTDQTRILIVETQGVATGLMVDSIAEVRNLRHSDIDSPPTVGNDENSKYLMGVSSTENGLLILIDLDKLVDTDLITPDF